MIDKQTSRRRLYGFILFSILEETIIAVIAFMLLLVFLPSFLISGIIIVAIALILFSLVKIYTYWSSSRIPIYDPLIGQEGIAITEFEIGIDKHWLGKVIVRGETWKAQSSEVIAKNARIWVHGISGLSLLVKTTPFEPEETKSRS
ncbi:MAG: NfeD family protein [Promethearchaeota archaeon]